MNRDVDASLSAGELLAQLLRPAPPTGLICALLTPPGRGAIATIGVRGPGAAALVERRFAPLGRQSLAGAPPGSVLVGRFRTAAAAAEELVVGRVGPEEIEIHGHGGPAAVAALLAALREEGCQVFEPRAWADASAGDPLTAAAWLALAAARTERTAAILLDQCRGALLAAVGGIARQFAAGDEEAARDGLAELLRWSELGLHLTHPWRVVLAGRPNAGKSSLLNALLGYSRAIVFDEPGTTRDVLTAVTAFDGWPVELADMAGLRETSEPLEAAGVRHAEAEIAAADLVLLVVDQTCPWDAALFETVSRRARRLLVVHSKCDLPAATLAAAPCPVIPTSAHSGQGLSALAAALLGQLVPAAPPPGTAIPFTHDQVRTLEAAAAALQRPRPAF
jgi:tRNA modification GTPase